MLKRKISEFSLLSTYNFEDRDEISDTDNIFSKKKNIKDEAIKTFCRIRKIDNNPGLHSFYFRLVQNFRDREQNTYCEAR